MRRICVGTSVWGQGGSNSFGKGFLLPLRWGPVGDTLVTLGLGFPRLPQPLVPVTVRSRSGDEGLSDPMGERQGGEEEESQERTNQGLELRFWKDK